MKYNVLAAMVGCMAFGAVSVAAITIDPPTSGFSWTNVPTLNGNEITITRLVTGGGQFWINASSPTDKIAFIKVTRSGTQNGITELRIGDPAGSDFPIESIGYIESINGSDAAIVAAYTGGDVGRITDMQRIDGLRIGGDVTGDITVILDASSGHFGADGNPNWIAGDMLGEISVEGDLRKFEIRGSFGNSGGAARTIRAYGTIWNLTIGEVLANAVVVGRNGSGALTSIQNLTIDDQWGASGDMDGEIIADDVEVLTTGGIPLIDIKGDLNGVIDLASAFDARMLIGGSFGADAEINLPSNGLVGQIAFNSANGSGTWAGDLNIGATAYPEEYSALPSTIGGGAAGNAPFTIHGEACSPQQGAFVFGTGLDPVDPELNCYATVFELALQLYGPISLTGDPDTAIDVMIKMPGESTYSAVPFSVDITVDTGSSGGSRVLRLTRDDEQGWPLGQYKIQPKAGRVPCMDVADATNATFTYEFELADGCGELLLETYDLNHDDTLCTLDIAERTTTPVDFNDDSAADGDDATLLLRAIDIYND